MAHMNKKGFSLIEIILVILVIGISSLGLVIVMQQVLFDIHKPRIISTATSLAESEAERVIRRKFISVVDENRDAPQAYSGSLSAYGWQVRVTDVDSDNKIAEIRVNHVAIGYVWLAFLKTNY